MPQFSVEPNSSVQFKIELADDNFLIINKPAGVVTQPGIGHHTSSLLNGLFARYGNALQSLGKSRDYGLIHRLDMQTSGLVVVGLTRNGVWPGGCMATAARGAADAYAGYDSIREQFRVRSVRKQYLALAHGTLRPASGIISVPIREARKSEVQRKVTNSCARTALRLRTTVVVRTCAHRSHSLASIRALSRPKHSIRRFRRTLR